MIQFFAIILSAFLPLGFVLAGTVEFKEKLEYANDIDSNDCYKLVVSNKAKGWFFKLNNLGDKARVIVYKCEMYDQKSGYGFGLKPGIVHGGLLRDQPYALNLSTGDLNKLSTPGWSRLANPSFCKDLIAFWKVEDIKNSIQKNVSAAIFDFKKNKMITLLKIGTDPTATDNLNYFGLPKWNKSCSEAEFTPAQSALKPTKLSVQ